MSNEMSAKEVKAILKDVREAIKQEKFDDAIRKCEEILKHDPVNYMAYLLLGAAYQNTNKPEAAKHLRKALEYSPGPPTVALQGLSQCATSHELPKIYEQLLELVPDKFSDYYEKLYQLAQDPQLAGECIEIFRKEKDHKENERSQLALKYLARVWLANNLPVAEQDIELFRKALEELLADPSADMHLNACRRYLKLLYNLKDLPACLRYACEVVEQYPDDACAYEWICKMYCDSYQKSQHVELAEDLKQPIAFYAEKLYEINENSSLALLMRVIDAFDKKQYVAARELLQRVQTLYPDFTPCLELLVRTHMKLGAFQMATVQCKKLGNVQREYGICLSHSSKNDQLKEAVALLLQQNQRDTEVVEALARCYHKLEERSKLEELPLPLVAKAAYLMSPTEAIESLRSTSESETFPVLLLLGQLLIDSKDYTEALTCMLKATRLNPTWSGCFLHLGEIYYALNDIVRARKCLEKCINLNPMCALAVKQLSHIYKQLGEKELNMSLLANYVNYVDTPEELESVQHKLGLQYFGVHKWDDAIQCFRSAIKSNPNCVIYWGSLGDAYNERGSYNSAIRVFQKILEMDPDNLYAKLQLALIKTNIRMYEEAISEFEALLRDHRDYLPGLKGIAEAHMGLANNLKADHRYGRCKHHLQEAVNYLQRAFLDASNGAMVWLWRQTGNLFLEVAAMPAYLATLTVSGQLANSTEERKILERKDLLKLAKRFYTIALQLKQNTYLWYDLALCCYVSAQYERERASEHLKAAMEATKMAISMAEQRWQNWNLLGVIHMHEEVNDLPLAQHCLIQALTLERKSYVSWANLGVLYLKLYDIKLANLAFQRAQQSSPVYPNAWIGQALIAELINEDEEALDLFRHCQQFHYHPESALGYAHWVCTVISNESKMKQSHYKQAIDMMFANAVALDAINWYVTNEGDDASVAALSFQGFLNERKRLYRPAARAYAAAVDRADSADEKNKLLTNLGFVYLKLNEPIEAINAFNKVSQATFTPIIGLAYACYRAEQYQESYSVYNSVLKSVSESDEEKAAKILVAMASMVYASQGEADTKTILYQCILLNKSPIAALYSACALGILHEDTQLTQTILVELKKYENQEEYCPDIAFLTSQYFLAKNKVQMAFNYLQSRINIFPHLSELRKLLAKFMLDHLYNQSPRQLKYYEPNTRMALGAITLTHRSITRKSDCVEDCNTLLIASAAFESLNQKHSLKLLERALHIYPQHEKALKRLSEFSLH